jgi:hypothetical protein
MTIPCALLTARIVAGFVRYDAPLEDRRDEAQWLRMPARRFPEAVRKGRGDHGDWAERGFHEPRDTPVVRG